MNRWKIKLLPSAAEELEQLDPSIQRKVFRALQKLERDPFSSGKALGSKIGIDLVGLFSLRAARIYRIVYMAYEHQVLVLVVSIGKRERLGAYQSAAGRIAILRQAAEKEMSGIIEMIREESKRVNSEE